MGPVTGGGVGPFAALNAEREVHAVPTGSPDGAVWSELAVTTCAGRQSATICARRRSGSVIASGTNVTPAHRHPSAATTKSTELPISRATRSPGSTPFCRNPAATLPAAERNSPRVNARSRSLTAGRSGARSAWHSTASSTPWFVTLSRSCCTRGSVELADRGFGQSLVDVVDDVVDVLDADRKPDRLRPDAGLHQLLVGQLAVGGGGRMDGEGLGVAQIEQPLDELERIEEGQARVVAPGDPEGDDGRHSPVQIALDQVVVGMVGEAGEAPPVPPAIGRQVVGHGASVGLVALEPQGHRLQALQEHEGIEGRQGGAAVAELSRAGPHGERSLGKVAGEDDIVEGGLG